MQSVVYSIGLRVLLFWCSECVLVSGGVFSVHVVSLL